MPLKISATKTDGVYTSIAHITDIPKDMENVCGNTLRRSILSNDSCWVFVGIKFDDSSKSSPFSYKDGVVESFLDIIKNIQSVNFIIDAEKCEEQFGSSLLKVNLKIGNVLKVQDIIGASNGIISVVSGEEDKILLHKTAGIFSITLYFDKCKLRVNTLKYHGVGFIPVEGPARSIDNIVVEQGEGEVKLFVTSRYDCSSLIRQCASAVNKKLLDALDQILVSTTASNCLVCKFPDLEIGEGTTFGNIFRDGIYAEFGGESIIGLDFNNQGLTRLPGKHKSLVEDLYTVVCRLSQAVVTRVKSGDEPICLQINKPAGSVFNLTDLEQDGQVKIKGENLKVSEVGEEDLNLQLYLSNHDGDVSNCIKIRTPQTGLNSVSYTVTKSLCTEELNLTVGVDVSDINKIKKCITSCASHFNTVE